MGQQSHTSVGSYRSKAHSHSFGTDPLAPGIWTAYTQLFLLNSLGGGTASSVNRIYFEEVYWQHMASLMSP